MPARGREDAPDPGGKERKAFLLRLSPEVYAEVKRWAARDLRSVNGQIEFLLREALRRHEKGETG